MISTSISTAALAPALLAAYKVVENVALDSTNPHFKNKYAGLPGVLEEVRAKLLTHGVMVLQFPSQGPNPESLYLTTRLLHGATGEFIEATAMVPLPKSDPQGFGSAMTYTRRYALLSIFGLVGEVDDDGNGASNGGNNSRPTSAPKPAPSRPAGPGPARFGAKPAAAPAKTGVVFGGKKAATPGPAKAPEKKKAGLFPTPASGKGGELVDKQPPIDRPETEGDESQGDET